MMKLSVIACLALVCAASSVSAYFELDSRIMGEPTKTVLADGRIKYEFAPKDREPFPKDVVIPAPTASRKAKADKAAGASMSIDETLDTDDSVHKQMVREIGQGHHFSLKGHTAEKAFAIVRKELEVVKLEEHVDMSKMICHDDGDQNMRLSLFSVSKTLMTWLHEKSQHLVISAHANQHTCHGEPILRRVTSVKVFGEEVLLLTDKARYEEIFDEADVHMEVKHPHLTHMDSDTDLFEHDADAEDHGVYARDEKETQQVNYASKNFKTLGAAAVTKSKELFYGEMSMDASAKAPMPLELETELNERQAKKAGWFKKAWKRVKKRVKKAFKRVVKSVKSTVSRVVKNVARGVKKVVNAVKKLLTINVNKNIDKRVTFQRSYTKNIKGVIVSFDFKFWTGFTFKLLIKTNRLYTFHASVYGGLNFGGGAKLPRKTRPDKAQSTMYTIPGPNIVFAIGPVPVWIKISVPIIGGWGVQGMSASFEVGFRVSASARFGVEYTRSRGFRTIADRYFRRSHTVKYDYNLQANAFLGAQIKFALYSFVAAFAQLNLDMGLLLTSRDPRCSLIKLTADLSVAVSAGLSINIRVLKFKIYAKKWGPWRIFKKGWRVINLCKKKPTWLAPGSKCRGNKCRELGLADADAEPLALLPATDGEEHMRIAQQLAGTSDDESGTEPVTTLSEDDSGMTWETEVKCNTGDKEEYAFTTQGFFSNDSTLFYITVSRNITDKDGDGYDLVQQEFLAYTDRNLSLGAKINATLVAPTAYNAAALGLDLEDLQDLTVDNKGSDNVSFVSINYVVMTFGATDLAEVAFEPENLCAPVDANGNKLPIKTKTLDVNKTAPAPPADGTYFGRMFASFGKQLWPAFVSMITDVLVVILVLAIIEMVAGHFVYKLVPQEHWPKNKQTVRIREKIYAVVAIVVGILAYIVFIVGINITFAEITGAQLIKNFTAPKVEDESMYVVASGINTIVWQFKGSGIKYRFCPQYGECSPDCRDFCKDVDYTWTTAAWPYCPEDAVATDNGGCTKWAFDAILWGIFSFLFLTVGTVVSLVKFDTVYRRMPAFHSCIMLSLMFLCLLWRRITSFMEEVEARFFEPSDEMVEEYTLYINSTSMDCWKTAITLFSMAVGFIGIAGIFEMYSFYKATLSGAITHWDDSFEKDGKDMNENGSGSPKSGYQDGSEALPAANPPSELRFDQNVLNDLENLDNENGLAQA